MDYVLGTANLGLPYGTAIARSLPAESQVASILDAALSSGIAWLDTAAAYGESEARIGRYLTRLPHDRPVRVSTKLSPGLDTGPADAGPATMAAIDASCNALQVSAIDQVLIHRWSQYYAAGGGIWRALLALRQDSRIRRLGASIQNPVEAVSALDACGVETIQLACNILDWRYDEPALAAALAGSSCRIEVRSALLQGLLTLAQNVRFPRTVEPHDESAIRRFVTDAARALTNGNAIALCLRYVASLPWADALVFGADTPQQLKENLDLLDAGPFTGEEMTWLRDQRPRVPAALLDPAQWR